MIDLSTYFGSLMMMASAVTLITGWVNTKWTGFTGWKTQALSWAISIGLAFIGAWKGLGLFEEADIVNTILNGLGVGLIANGIFTVEYVQHILTFLQAKNPK